MSKKIDALFAESKLKKTSLRTELLGVLMSSKSPMSQVEILQKLGQRLESVDRVTVYRNLKQFREKGLVHELDVNQYIFCEHDCHEHAHLLFFCTQCQRHTEVRDHQKIDSFLKILQDFRFFSSQEPLSLRGTCKHCSSEKPI